MAFLGGRSEKISRHFEQHFIPSSQNAMHISTLRDSTRFFTN
jgi:hypothetical protein